MSIPRYDSAMEPLFRGQILKIDIMSSCIEKLSRNHLDSAVFSAQQVGEEAAVKKSTLCKIR